jgi:hypothetical protein
MSSWLNSITHAISKIRVKSVVDSLGKLLLLSLLVFLLAAIFVKETWVLIALICFPGLLLLMYLVSHFYCLFKNPDLLRSEEYNIKKQVVEVLGDKDNHLLIDSDNLASIANPNPYLGSLLEGKEEADGQ